MGIGPPFNMVASKKKFFEPKIFLADFSKKFFRPFYGHIGYQTDPLGQLIPMEWALKNSSHFRSFFGETKKIFFKIIVGPLRIQFEKETSSRLPKNKNYYTTSSTRLSPPGYNVILYNL